MGGDQQHINVTNIQRNEGCFGGCGTLVAVVLVIGIAVEYWYLSVGLAVIGAGVGYYLYRTRDQRAVDAVQQPVGAVSAGTAPTAAVCANCGASEGVGAFCPYCGTATGRTCAGCGKSGLRSVYCPDCGSATMDPIPPA